MVQLKIPSFDQMPAVLAQLAQDVAELKQTPAPATEPEKPINVPEAAEHIHNDIQTVYKYVRLKKIPHHKKNGRLYFFKSELNEWLKS
jgi:hypothetical protein